AELVQLYEFSLANEQTVGDGADEMVVLARKRSHLRASGRCEVPRGEDEPPPDLAEPLRELRPPVRQGQVPGDEAVAAGRPPPHPSRARLDGCDHVRGRRPRVERGGADRPCGYLRQLTTKVGGVAFVRLPDEPVDARRDCGIPDTPAVAPARRRGRTRRYVQVVRERRHQSM